MRNTEYGRNGKAGNNLNSPRGNACFRHCRLRKINENDLSHQGICPCLSPSECLFDFPQVTAEDSDLMFDDVKKFYHELNTE